MKSILILLISILSVCAQVSISGRVSMVGRVSISVPAPAAPTLTFSDFHYSDNYPSNATPHGTFLGYFDPLAIGHGFTNSTATLISEVGSTVVYDIYFQVAGSGGLNITSVTFRAWYAPLPGSTTLLNALVNGHESGYDTGTQFFLSSVQLVVSHDPCDPAGSPINYGDFTLSPAPQANAYIHIQFNLQSTGDTLSISEFNLNFNQ